MEDIQESMGYKMGQMLSLAANAQYWYSNRKTDTIITQYWNQLISNPCNVLPELSRQVNAIYIPGIRRTNQGKAYMITKELSELWQNINFNDFKTFNTKDKVAFIMGFEAQQRKYFVSKNKETNCKETESTEDQETESTESNS